MALVHRWRDEAVRAGAAIKRIVLAFEADRDGFWLARWLIKRGIEALVAERTRLVNRARSVLARFGISGWPGLGSPLKEPTT